MTNLDAQGNSRRFEGKLALVTGASGGIGEAVVRRLHAEGARVMAVDITADGVTALAAELGDRVRAGVLDVSDSAAVEMLVAQTEADWGAIDLGANVAGVLTINSVIDTPDAGWQHMFAVNTHGVFHVSRALASRMKARGRGAMVTVSSNAAGVPRQNMAAYAASKAAASMFTRCLGLELAPYGVRCNIVAPGSTLTAMQTGMWADENGAQQTIKGSPATFKNGIPLGKLATPDEVAASIVFLLSDEASHITMASLYVDGGATLCT